MRQPCPRPRPPAPAVPARRRTQARLGACGHAARGGDVAALAEARGEAARLFAQVLWPRPSSPSPFLTHSSASRPDRHPAPGTHFPCRTRMPALVIVARHQVERALTVVEGAVAPSSAAATASATASGGVGDFAPRLASAPSSLTHQGGKRPVPP